MKLERIPINIGLGVCLGMVPLIAYNFGAGDRDRMRSFLSLSRTVILSFSVLCTAVFRLFAEPLVGLFISDGETIAQGAVFLQGRCLALPFMMIGYHIVNYMNAVDKGKTSFLLALLRHIGLIIPVLFLMNWIWGLTGLVWSQLTADGINAVLAVLIFFRTNRAILQDTGN